MAIMAHVNVEGNDYRVNIQKSIMDEDMHTVGLCDFKTGDGVSLTGKRAVLLKMAKEIIKKLEG